MVHSCVVHVPVKAIGKKWRITFFPLKSERETSFSAEDTKVNWGAGWPDCNDIDNFLVQKK